MTDNDDVSGASKLNLEGYSQFNPKEFKQGPATVQRCVNCFRETAEALCPHCGWLPGHPTRPPYIPVGTVLNDCYLVGRVLGHGGFGITYLGWDSHLDLPIAIKEYFPRSLATRVGDDLTLSVYPGEKRVWFDDSLHRFQEEAKILARFKNHPCIVGVYSFFHANGTCYMVMEYMAGVTLKSYLKHKGRLSYKNTLKVLTPVMDALYSVHQVKLLHRDVSPHNIYITQEKKVKLLDFGAARCFTQEQNNDLSVILKLGYSPPEQYSSQGNQGPWTDVYGLAATFYNCLTGETPPDAADRLQQDCLKSLSACGVRIPLAAEAALLKGLALDVKDRFQDIESFREAFPKHETTETKIIAPIPPKPSPQQRKLIPVALIIGIVAIILLLLRLL